MTILAFGVGLPLSLMRNLHSLANFSALSLLFYAGFVLQVCVVITVIVMLFNGNNYLYFLHMNTLMEYRA